MCIEMYAEGGHETANNSAFLSCLRHKTAFCAGVRIGIGNRIYSFLRYQGLLYDRLEVIGC